MPSKPYNGHPSWNHWNVSLWLSNDEGLYRYALDCIRRNKRLSDAAQEFIGGVGAGKTPDGAKYSFRSVYHALKGLKED